MLPDEEEDREAEDEIAEREERKGIATVEPVRGPPNEMKGLEGADKEDKTGKAGEAQAKLEATSATDRRREEDETNPSNESERGWRSGCCAEERRGMG